MKGWFWVHEIKFGAWKDSIHLQLFHQENKKRMENNPSFKIQMTNLHQNITLWRWRNGQDLVGFWGWRWTLIGVVLFHLEWSIWGSLIIDRPFNLPLVFLTMDVIKVHVDLMPLTTTIGVKIHPLNWKLLKNPFKRWNFVKNIKFFFFFYLPW